MTNGICYARGYYLSKVGWVVGLLVCFSGVLLGQEGGSVALPEGEGKELVRVVCNQCHGLRSTLMLRNSQEGWREVVDRMVTNGARISPEEASTIIQYLSANFGPGRNPIRTGPFPPPAAQREVSLPAGAGKDVVEARCGLCHDLGWVVAQKRSRADWEAVIKNMIARGPQATPGQVQTIITYLTSHFGKDTN